jgi:hypothetical protein
MKRFNQLLDATLIGVALAATFLLAAIHVLFIVVITIVRAAWRA